jgi:UDPglucose 6-dehydrogenase
VAFKNMNYFLGPKIGFIGLGFVGNAIASLYDEGGFEVKVRDPAKNLNSSWEELKECEGIFICVPSPSNTDGSCDGSILEDVLSYLKDYQGVIISKVTATPDIYEKLQKIYPNLVYVPEFLTAANAIEDYKKEDWAVIGGQVLAYQREAERIIKYVKKDVSVVYCSAGEAALYKYVVNSFLATKVVFMNEMHDLSLKCGYDWNKIKAMLLFDNRIGPSHTKVPGPDGQYGFGGMCFPKDTSAILKYAEKLNCDLNVLSNAVKKNTLLRLKKPK